MPAASAAAIWGLSCVNKRRTLLLGDAPEAELGLEYVNAPPYDAVLLGSITLGALLCFQEEHVLAALANGIPVYAWLPGLPHAGKNPGLGRRLARARRELQELGVIFLRRSACRQFWKREWRQCGLEQ